MANTKTERPSARRSAAGAKRRGGREDRDGDVSMDAGAKGRGRVGKTPSGPKSAAPPTGPSAMRGGRSIKGAALSGDQLQRRIARAAASGDVSMREPKSTPRGSLVEFKVTGWDKSTASDSADRGAGSLVSWLESRTQKKLGSASRRPVKFKKWSVNGDVLSISVQEADAGYLQRMNGFQWAKAKLSIERVGGPASDPSQNSKTEETKTMLRDVLASRYNESAKLLDLSSLGQDPELSASAIFNTKSTASKFFPAMMVVLENAFETKEKLNAAIESVSLAGNQLEDLTAVSSLSLTLPKLKNLDLSNNRLGKLQALENWRRRFYNLHHLIISGNPLEQNDPNYVTEFLKWYPHLQFVNNVQVRTEQEIASKSSITNIRFPIRHANFHDEDGIAETFIRNFFLGFDTDRPALAAMYYDDASDFSFALNTSAPRDPAGTVQTTQHEWDAYIKGSRNLKKISQLPARQQRMFRGAKAIAGIFTSMPKTKHPDLGSEARKWLIECHIQPGIPDATGNSPNGVDGFSINIHGEYDEIDPSSNQPTKKRSFDHFIQLGPALPGSSSIVRVVNHQMTVRAYGGAQAFEPDNIEGGQTGSPPPQQQPNGVPPLPEGLTVELAEQMVNELTKQTGMTLGFSKDCLVQCAWDFNAALAAFQQVKPNLPPAAFVQV